MPGQEINLPVDTMMDNQKKWKGSALVENCVNDVTYHLRISPESRKVVHLTYSNLILVTTYLGGWKPYTSDYGTSTMRTWRQEDLQLRH